MLRRLVHILSIALLATGLLVVPGSVFSGASAAAALRELCAPTPGRMRCLAERLPAHPDPGGRLSPTSVAGYAAPLTPADLRSAYQVPASTTTRTVAVVDAYDEPDAEANLARYRAQYGLPPCTSANGCFRKVNQDGAPAPLPGYDSGWATEIDLDVQMVSAICPTCHILLVEANDNDASGQPNLEIAAATAARLGARYVSMSWGGSEWPGESSLAAQYLAAPGVTYVASAGDSGYGPIWPAASSGVIAVGGTSLSQAPGIGRGWTETAWSGTGSGCSADEPQPAAQAAVPAIGAVCRNRAMTDVAVVADPRTGVAVYQGGQWWQVGGTSVGAPVVAAMQALAGSDASGAAAVAYPYAHAGDFVDITAGSNGSCGTRLCAAAPGWDGPTGLGSPIGLAGFGAASSAAPAPPTPPTAPTPPPTLRLRNPGTVSSWAGVRVAVSVAGTDSARLPVTYRASGLPPGTALGATGVIGGVPRSAGTFQVTVAAHDSAGTAASVRFTWTVRLHRVVPSATPRVTGTVARGHTVAASWGTWRRDSARGAVIRPAVHVQWYIDGHAISHATGRTFRTPWTWRGRHLSFRVIATATYYHGYVSYSRRTAGVR